MAQSVERVLGKDEVTGSIPVSSSKRIGLILWFDLFLSVLELQTGDSPLTRHIFVCKNNFIIRRVTVTRLRTFAFGKKRVCVSEQSLFRRKTKRS